MPNYTVAHNNLSYAYFEKFNYGLAMQHAKAAERYGLKVSPHYMDDLEKSLDPQYLRARHILVKTKAAADSIVIQVGAGASFPELALNKSLDKNTASKGGDLGYFKKGDMSAEFENAILGTKVGKVSGVVKTDLGYHVFQRLK